MPLRVPPIPEHPEMSAWVNALNTVFDSIEATLTALQAAAELDMQNQRIINVTNIVGPSSQRGFVRILPGNALVDQADTSHRVPGVDTVSRSKIETSLDSLGARINDVRDILESLRRTS